MPDSGTQTAPLPPAAIHVDVDGWWAIRNCYGDREAAPGDPDRVYEEGLPALGDLFAELKVPAEFFVVGADARVASKRGRLAKLGESHYIENHSDTHDLRLGFLPHARMEQEVDDAHAAISDAVGRAPVGFRAPGYTASPALWRILAERGYQYDSSILPTWSGPLLRLVDAWISGSRPKRHQYGPASRVFAPQIPYHPMPGGAASGACQGAKPEGTSPADNKRELLEFPVLVSAPWRMPLQAGMLLSRGLAPLESTLRRLQSRGEPIVFLLHAIDAVDTSAGRHPLPSSRGARFFNLTQAEKISRLRAMIGLIAKYRRLTTLKELAGSGGGFPS